MLERETFDEIICSCICSLDLGSLTDLLDSWDKWDPVGDASCTPSIGEDMDFSLSNTGESNDKNATYGQQSFKSD